MTKKKIKNNFNMKVLSVIIAVIIWIIVGNINDPVISRDISGVQVEFINEKVLDKIHKAYELEDSDKITITVSGKKSIVSRLRARDFTATADLSKLSIVDAVPVEVSLNHDASGQVSIDLGKNTMMRVKIDDVETVTVPVSIEIEGEPASGYAVGKKTASPNMIEVTGPATSIENIEEVKLTCDVSGANKDIEKDAEVEFYSKKGKKLDSSRLKYDETSIAVSVEIWRQKTIPIEVETEGDVADGYTVASVEYEPKTVVIAGPDDELADIGSIELEKVDISDATSDVEKNISLSDTLLPGNIIFLESNKTVAVKVKIGKRIEKTLTFSPEDIQVVGAGDNATVSFLEEEYEVTISGLEEDIQDIKIKDLEPHIQVEEYSDGTYDISIRFVDNKNIEVESIDKATVEIENSSGASSSSSSSSSFRSSE